VFEAEPQQFRHYIYGVPDKGEEEFLTTMLSYEGAVDFATKHGKQFQDRFCYYSIRNVDVEVGVV
jgi:hypothetical protein